VGVVEPCDPSADFIFEPAVQASDAPLVNMNAITATSLK
jgi:hypothetical protein